jgi:hypothetical protein
MPNPWVSLQDVSAHPGQQGGEQEITIGKRAGGGREEEKNWAIFSKLIWSP